MSQIKTIQDKVDLQISETMGVQVEDWVVNHMVDRELQKRGPVIAKALDGHSKLLDELKKLDRPDHIIKDKDQKVIFEGYTAKRSDEVKKLKEKIQKLENATDRAFKDGDLKELNQLLQSFGDKQDKKESESGAGETAS